MNKSIGVLLIISFIGLIACQRNTTNSTAWLSQHSDKQHLQLQHHLRGLDVAMVEIGYRYQELYWAGIDQNWHYANYQLDKIKLSLELASERRPLREISARHFLDEAIPSMKTAVESQDSSLFIKGFQTFTNQCNACHSKEKVAFFHVVIPNIRQSPIQIQP